MIGQCDCCRYKEADVQEYGEFDMELGRRPRYCDMCAETFASLAVKRQDILGNPANFYRTMMYSFNKLLHEVRKAKGAR